jgi:DNA-entry nuclease
MNKRIPALLMALALTLLCACAAPQPPAPIQQNPAQSGAAAEKAEKKGESGAFFLEDMPEYAGEPYVVVNDNVPYFTEDDLTTESFEYYDELDAFNRCGVTIACVGQDLMPTEERGSIGQVKPTGWQTVKYENVDGKYLYNRCHLIGFQLTGENANERNLITGTRAMNVDGMLPFENMVADYVKETENHVLYRVTPIFVEEEMVARGVLMEAVSVEDKGEGVEFCVYVYNNQPGILIDYATGESTLAPEEEETQNGEELTYILNTCSQKFHFADCGGVDTIKEENRSVFTGSRADVVAAGYEPCGRCKP